MTEDEINYLFESKDKYPVNHETIAKYITAPKKVSIKKMIEQTELLAVKDFIVSMNEEYSFTLNAFKNCIINYKCKFVKLFLTVEENIFNERIAVYTTRISQLEQQLTTLNSNSAPVIKKDVTTSVEHTTVNEDLQTNIINTLDKISTQLESLSDIKEQINKISEITLISAKLDKLLNIDIIKQLDNHSKKINSINIL